MPGAPLPLSREARNVSRHPGCWVGAQSPQFRAAAWSAPPELPRPALRQTAKANPDWMSPFGKPGCSRWERLAVALGKEAQGSFGAGITPASLGRNQDHHSSSLCLFAKMRTQVFSAWDGTLSALSLWLPAQVPGRSEGHPAWKYFRCPQGELWRLRLRPAWAGG